MKIKQIADSGIAPVVCELVQEMMNEVADVRNKMNVRPEIENEVRLAVCEVLQEKLLLPIKRQKGETTPIIDESE